MKNIKKWITSPASTVILFVLAAGLLLFSTIGGARAAFIAVSQTYAGHLEMYDIGVSLLEKCEGDEEAREVATRRSYSKNTEDTFVDEESKPLLEGANFLGTDSTGKINNFLPGKVYKEEISVANTGNIDEYVRVTLYRYWIDASGNKNFTSNAKGTSTQGLAPELIKLELANTDSWLFDNDVVEKDSKTEEKMVFYYNKVLKAGESLENLPLCKSLSIDKSIADKCTQYTSEDGHTITTVYDYDGWSFCLEAQVDAVQDHNAKDAIKSAWGVDVNIAEDGTLSLAN